MSYMGPPDVESRGGRGEGRGGRGEGRGGRGLGRGRGEGRGGRGFRRPDPQPCPITIDEEGSLRMKACILILREFAGAVIGHRGDHVAEIRKETGAFVHVCKPDLSTGVQGVDVFGHVSQLIAAQAKITAVLAANAGDWCTDTEWGPRLRMQLLPDMASIIIGKKGTNVQRIHKSSGAKIRIDNEPDATNLQSCQLFGTNDEVSTAFALIMESISTYDAAGSRLLPRLRESWDANRANVEDEEGSGGSSRGGRYSEGGRGRGYDRERYEPYRREGRGGQRSPYRQEVPSPNQVVVMPGGVSVPGIGGQMPTVLIQQADGTLVQAQVMTQNGGQYSVQPATQVQGAVTAMKTTYGTAPPLSLQTTPAGGGGMVAQIQQPQQQMQQMHQGGAQVVYSNAVMAGGQSAPPIQGGMYAVGGSASGGGGQRGPAQVQLQGQPAGAEAGAYGKVMQYSQGPVQAGMQQGISISPQQGQQHQQGMAQPGQQQHMLASNQGQRSQQQQPQQYQQSAQGQSGTGYGGQPSISYGQNSAYSVAAAYPNQQAQAYQQN